MIEIRGDKKVLITPISEEDLADIKIGDIVWLDGELMTCRDVAHRRLVEYGRELPYDIKDKAIFHAGPIVRKIEGTEDDYEMVSVGPTTSMRMEKFEYEFTKLTGVRVIVGKGGMGPNTERACKEFGAIHCVFPAGCAVVAETEVEKIVVQEICGRVRKAIRSRKKARTDNEPLCRTSKRKAWFFSLRNCPTCPMRSSSFVIPSVRRMSSRMFLSKRNFSVSMATGSTKNGALPNIQRPASSPQASRSVAVRGMMRLYRSFIGYLKSRI